MDFDPAVITVGRDGVWLANSVNDSVSRIDPATGRVATTIAVGDEPVEVAADERGLWVANAASGTAMRVDPRHRLVAQTVDVGSGPGAIAAGSGTVWVANPLDGTASRIDPPRTRSCRRSPSERLRSIWHSEAASSGYRTNRRDR